MTLQEITGLITVVSFVGGIAIFLFKKIVIEPLQRSIDALNSTLKEFKVSTEKNIEMLEKRVDIVEDKATRHDEQIKSLFKLKEAN